MLACIGTFLTFVYHFQIFSKSLLGFGVGGNLPVDGALFLEFLPGKDQYLLTLLSLWWAVGQVVASLISWVFLAKLDNPSTEVCSDSGLTKYFCADIRATTLSLVSSS
jgi:MFS family permease